MTELTDEDRDLVLWFAEERLGWENKRTTAEWWRDEHGNLMAHETDLLGWPGFGLAVEEARKAGLAIELQHEPTVEDPAYAHRVRLDGVRADHYHTDPALAAYAALRDALR